MCPPIVVGTNAMIEVFKFVKRAGSSAIPHSEIDRKALDAAIIILVNC